MTHELSTRLQTQPATTDPDHLELARRANDAHRHVVGAARAAVKYALEAGRALAEAKRLCPGGAWGDWVDAHFHGSLRTAQRYVRLAQCWPQLEAAAADAGRLSHNEAVRLLSKLSHRGEDSTAVNSPSQRRAGLRGRKTATALRESPGGAHDQEARPSMFRVADLLCELAQELDRIIQSGDSSDTEFAEMIRHALIPANDHLDQWFRPRAY